MLDADRSADLGATQPMMATEPLAGRPTKAIQRWHKPVFILFLLAWAVTTAILALRIELPPLMYSGQGTFVLLATATSLLALGRRLPWQNVLMAGFLIGFLAAGILAVGVASGVPFGPVVFGDELGGKLLGLVPWTLPLWWVVVIINGRGVARLIMRPWRKTNFYGFWVIGLTCSLATVFDLGLEPFAAQTKGWWVWVSSRTTLAWGTAPWVNFLGWFVAALSILAFAIPWLINKQPIKQAMDYHPLVVWMLLNITIAAGNAAHQQWSAVILCALGNGAALVFAVRGARW